ncbi:MAG: FHA domain-containing protein [Thermodesulfobacteriota bacterium]
MIVKLRTRTDRADRSLNLTSFPFVFGREAEKLQTPAYSTDEAREELKHVSRQHATFSSENGAIFLADNKSLNGTRVNDEPLDQTARQLRTGDLIIFANRFEYVADLDDSKRSPLQPPLYLHRASGSDNDRIEISSLPFLLSSGELNQKKSKTDDDFVKIEKQGAEYVLAPLIPQSGIRLDGRKISGGAHVLNEGSLIEFAPNGSYRFSLHDSATQEKPAAAPVTPGSTDSINTAASQPSSSEPAEDATIYMDEATSFLGVFSEDEQQALSQKTQSSPKHQGVAPLQKPAAARKQKRSLLLYGIIGIIFCALAGGTVFYLRSTPESVARKLYKEKQYPESLIAADTILASKKENKEFQAIGLQSLIQTTLPSFLGMLGEHDTQAVAELLHTSRQRSSHIRNSANILDSLQFVERVDQLLTVKSQEKSTDEWQNEITEINSFWQEHKSVYRPIYDEMTLHVPAFRPVLENFHRQLNDSRESEIYEVGKIKKTEQELHRLAGQKKFNELSALINDFDTNHPGLINHARWLADLDRYRQLITALESHEIFTRLTAFEQSTMQTRVFSDLVEKHIIPSRPSAKTSSQLNSVRDLWIKGEAQPALSLLSSVDDKGWNQLVAQETKKMERVSRLFGAATGTGNPETACQAVSMLHTSPRPFDMFYIDQTVQIKKQCRQQAQQNYSAALLKAKDIFSEYLKQGGISGQMRLASSVSKQYRSQAEKIGSAHQLILQAKNSVSEGALTLSKDDQVNVDLIEEEYDMQVSRLQGSHVLSAELLKEKLALFQPKNTQ